MNACRIRIKPDEVDKLTTALAEIEKLPLGVIAGEVVIPIWFASGDGVSLVLEGGKTCAAPKVPKTDDPLKAGTATQIKQKLDGLMSAGMTQTEISRACGVPASTLWRWSIGKSYPRDREGLSRFMHLQAPHAVPSGTPAGSAP